MVKYTWEKLACFFGPSFAHWNRLLKGKAFPLLSPRFLDCWCGDDEGHTGPPGAMFMSMVVHSPGSATKFGQILRFSCLQGLWGDTWVISIAKPHRNLFLFRIKLKHSLKCQMSLIFKLCKVGLLALTKMGIHIYHLISCWVDKVFEDEVPGREDGKKKNYTRLFRWWTNWVPLVIFKVQIKSMFFIGVAIFDILYLILFLKIKMVYI